MENKLEQCKSNKETLALLQMLHGKNVMCTDGLFHILDDKHNEAYINLETAQLDTRGLYRTLVVMSNIVVAKVMNNNKVKFVVLDKSNLKCIYKTTGNIFYIDDNFVCDKNKKGCLLIGHSGKLTEKFEDALCIKKVYGNNYLVCYKKMFADKLLHYNEHSDKIIDLTEGKHYNINIISDTEIEITPMEGGEYIYNFETKTYTDKFNNKEKKTLDLFRII